MANPITAMNALKGTPSSSWIRLDFQMINASQFQEKQKSAASSKAIPMHKYMIGHKISDCDVKIYIELLWDIH